MKKKSVLFVCLGNICRSPAAEAIFMDLIHKKCLANNFIVDSAGTGSWHIGKKADSRMRIAAKKRNLHILSRARQINIKDFENFDYILTMDNSNYFYVKDFQKSRNVSGSALIKKIQDFRSAFNEEEVPDPYFGGDQGFDNVLDILEDSVSGFLKSIY